MHRFYLLILALSLSALTASRGATSPQQALRELTGGRTRVVWIQDLGDGSDYLAQRNQLRLMAFDTDDRQGERVLVEGPRNIAKPMLTPDGNRVVFSDRQRREMFMIGWNESEPRSLGPGFALHVWQDPETSVNWLYYTKKPVDDGKVLQTHEAIYRRGLPPYPRSWKTALQRLRGAFHEERIWSQTHVSEDNFQLSANGRYASTVFPWPEAGILDMETGDWHRFGRGCWVSIAPDNSGYFWIFDGPHRNLIMHQAGRPVKERWPVLVAGLPETSDYEVYHPRWANHPFILAVTGPYKIGEGSHRLAGGGEEVEVHVGRLNPDYTGIEQWVKVTDNAYANFYPDIWVDPSAHQTAPAVEGTARDWSTSEDAAWPLSSEGLVYLWENLDGQTEVHGRSRDEGYLCRPQPVGYARYNRDLGMLLEQGAFLDSDAGARALEAIEQSGSFSIELTVYPGSTEPPPGEACLAAFDLDGQTAFLLGLRSGQLFFRVHGEDHTVPTPSLHSPFHLVAAYGSGRLTVYLDGEPQMTSLLKPVALAGHQRQLVFGGGNWEGGIDGIALYNRPLGPELVMAKSTLRTRDMDGRLPPDQVSVRGRLIATTAPPHPDDIAPYRRALISHEYEVLEVLQGVYEEPSILVASWAILDAQVLEHAERTPGEERELLLERFDDRPELEGERLAMDTDNLLLDLYFEPGVPPSSAGNPVPES